MANPTRTALLAEINSAASAVLTTTSGPVTDAELDNLSMVSVTVVDNLDPDRPVKIRQLGRV